MSMEVGVNPLDYIENGYCLLQRVIYIDTVTPSKINKLIRVFHLMEQESDMPITIYLNCPGGTVMDGFAMYDTIRKSNAWIHTIALGKVMSMGLVLFVSGDERSCYDNTTFMAHEVSSSSEGTVTSMKVDLEETVRLNDRMAEVLSDNTKKNMKWWSNMIKDTDKYFTKVEAKKYGVVK